MGQHCSLLPPLLYVTRRHINLFPFISLIIRKIVNVVLKTVSSSSIVMYTINNTLFTHQQMHFLLNLEKFKFT